MGKFFFKINFLFIILFFALNMVLISPAKANIEFTEDFKMQWRQALEKQPNPDEFLRLRLAAILSQYLGGVPQQIYGLPVVSYKANFLGERKSIFTREVMGKINPIKSQNLNLLISSASNLGRLILGSLLAQIGVSYGSLEDINGQDVEAFRARLVGSLTIESINSHNQYVGILGGRFADKFHVVTGLPIVGNDLGYRIADVLIHKLKAGTIPTTTVNVHTSSSSACVPALTGATRPIAAPSFLAE